MYINTPETVHSFIHKFIMLQLNSIWFVNFGAGWCCEMSFNEPIILYVTCRHIKADNFRKIVVFFFVNSKEIIDGRLCACMRWMKSHRFQGSQQKGYNHVLDCKQIYENNGKIDNKRHRTVTENVSGLIFFWRYVKCFEVNLTVVCGQCFVWISHSVLFRCL